MPVTEIELDVEDLAHDGRGVARNDGKTVFVRGALPGERVRAGLKRRKRNFDEAETLEVLSPSAERVEPRCQHFGVCGACVLQHLAPAAQIAAKQKVLEENLRRIGHVEPQTWLPPLTAEPWSYRRKGRLSVRHVQKKGRTLVGFREANPRFVADLSRCEIMHPALGPKLAELAQLVDSMEGKADIPQIEFAAGDETVALVVRHLKPLSDADRERWRNYAELEGFAVYLQPGGNDSVTPLWPPQPRLRFSLPGDVDFEFEPLDFVQINAAINRQMVDRVLELFACTSDMRVLDLFCGLGNFSLPLARRAGEVSAVEGDAGLMERARANATRNGIDNVEFHVANLFEDHRQASWARQDWDAILLDPPRAGAEQVLAYLPRKATPKVVYVSCHPGSLARDAAILVNKHGMVLRSAGVMDMFPHTAHVESIAVFERP